MVTAKQLGLKYSWDKKDKEEVFEHNRELWKEYLERQGLNIHHNNSDIPGFEEAVRFEIEVLGYGLTNVAQTYGLLSGSIKHMADKNGWEAPGMGEQYRIWDDDVNRFVNVTKQEYIERAPTPADKRKEKHRERRTRRMIKQITAIREFAAENDRVPTLEELAEMLDQVPQHFAYDWGYDSRDENSCTYAEAWDRLYAAAAAGERLKPFEHLGAGQQMNSREEGTLGYRLTQLRLERDETLEEIANKTGLNKATVGRHERNKVHPSDKNITIYSQCFGVVREWLETGRGDMHEAA